VRCLGHMTKANEMVVEGSAAPVDGGGAGEPLRRQLGVRDMVLAQVLCVVGSSWVGVAAGLGRAQTVMWLAAMLVFYLPMGAMVIALNTAMPLEGGLYVWAHKAFGDLWGFLTAWNLWVYGVAVTATILYAIPTEISYLIGPSAAWLPENHLASLGIVGAILLAITLAALHGLDWGKWIHNVGGAAMLTVFVVLILLPAYGLWRGTLHHGMEFTATLPPMNLRSMALFGQMIFGALCGLEYIAIFAGESRQPAKNIARSVWIASPVICLMFVLGTSSVVAFARGKIDFIAPIPQTLRLALGDSGVGNVMAILAILLVQLRLLGAASFLFTGVTRLPLTVGWDRMLPEWFTRLDARKTPVNSIVFTAVLVLALVVLAGVGVHAQEAFQVLTNASLEHYELTYLAMFAIPMVGAVALRKQLPAKLKWIGLVGFLATLFSLLISAYPFVDVVDPAAYAAKIVGTVVVSNLIAVGFYWVRRRNGFGLSRV
jgi:glutamate:GABA antiporter